MLLVQSRPAALVNGQPVQVFGVDDVKEPLRNIFDLTGMLLSPTA